MKYFIANTQSLNRQTHLLELICCCTLDPPNAASTSCSDFHMMQQLDFRAEAASPQRAHRDEDGDEEGDGDDDEEDDEEDDDEGDDGD